jgi:KDO2-lipid IV(A) lauroyltransferase
MSGNGGGVPRRAPASPEIRPRHRAEHAAFRLFRGALLALPHRAARPLGRALGELARLLDRGHRRVALDNVALAFPELPAAERRRLVRRCFHHFGGVLAEVVSMSRFDPVTLCRHLTFDGWEHVAAAEARGRGVFILSAHLGNWEVLAHAVSLYRGALHVVARPADNPLLDRELQALRERFGNVTIAKRRAARQMLRVIRGGGRVGILIDQRVPAAEAIVVPFFGRPALTTPVLARMSLRTGAPVVPSFGVPLPDGRVALRFRPPLFPAGHGEAAVWELTQRYLTVLEDEIRRAPHLWLWLHRRWLRPEEPG